MSRPEEWVSRLVVEDVVHTWAASHSITLTRKQTADLVMRLHRSLPHDPEQPSMDTEDMLAWLAELRREVIDVGDPMLCLVVELNRWPMPYMLSKIIHHLGDLLYRKGWQDAKEGNRLGPDTTLTKCPEPSGEYNRRYRSYTAPGFGVSQRGDDRAELDDSGPSQGNEEPADK